MSSKVHHVKFYRPKPKAIYCMALNRQLKKLALSRSDASIEIWNVKSAPFIESRIPNSVENYSIEGLAWADDRLFSVGLHALLIEYDLKKLIIKQQTSVTGQTAFCLDVSPSKSDVCVGTEQGYINIFNITEGLVFNKFLDKQEGRILCLKYDSSGNYMASSSLDFIRVWDVQSGHALFKMTTGRSAVNKPTIVWCLQITKEFTIITGDSRGKLTFWDGKIGAQIESYQSHKADILSLCLSENEDELYCSGIDPNINNYQKVTVKDKDSKWVKCIQRSIHDHDVRALALCKGKLFSGGVDGYLGYSYHPPKVQVKFAPLLPKTCARLAQEARLILLQYSKHLEVWNLSKSHEITDNNLSKMLEIKRERKTDLGDKREGILSSAISSDGQYIVFSTQSTLRLLHFEFNDQLNLTVIELQEQEECFEPYTNVSFTSDSKFLMGASRSGRIHVIKLQGLREPSLVQTIETEQFLKDLIVFLRVSTCNQYLIAADITGNIAVWLFDKSKTFWKYFCQLPRYKGSLTAMNYHSKTGNLVLAYSDHKVFEYNLQTKKLQTLDNVLSVKSSDLFHYDFVIKNIQFDSRNDNIIVFNDEQDVIVVNKEWKILKNFNKKSKIEGDNVGALNDPKKYAEKVKSSAITKYKHIAQLEWLSDDELVAVQVNPLDFLSQLPPGFKQNKFGSM